MYKLLKIALDLFDGGAAGGDGAGAGAGAPTAAQGETNGTPGSTRRGSGEFSNVVFGKQDTVRTDATDAQQAAAADKTPDVQVTSNTLEEKRKAFSDMIRGEYKDVYTEETQRMIDKRFKEMKGYQDKLAKAQRVLDLMGGMLNVKSDDYDALYKAVDDDNRFWASLAEEDGQTVDQKRAYVKLKIENDARKRAEAEQDQQKFVRERVEDWYKQGEALKTKFPKFDLGAELQDPAFVSMLKSGTPVEHAYKVCHFDEIMNGAINVTAAQTQAAVVANVRARGARPQENGTASRSSFTVKDDVSKLTREERAEIARRAGRGEIIRF